MDLAAVPPDLALPLAPTCALYRDEAFLTLMSAIRKSQLPFDSWCYHNALQCSLFSISLSSSLWHNSLPVYSRLPTEFVRLEVLTSTAVSKQSSDQWRDFAITCMLSSRSRAVRFCCEIAWLPQQITAKLECCTFIAKSSARDSLGRDLVRCEMFEFSVIHAVVQAELGMRPCHLCPFRHLNTQMSARTMDLLVTFLC